MSPGRSAEEQWEHDKQLMRLEIVEGLIAAQDRWAQVSDAIAEAEDRAAAVESLRALLDISEPVSHHILDMTLGRRSRLGRAELADERERLRALLKGA